MGQASQWHGLASQLGGSLTLSTPGLGTNVVIWLPVTRIAASADEPAAEPPLAGRAGGRALLVDDEELVRASTADMLGELGYSVTDAASAKEARGW